MTKQKPTIALISEAPKIGMRKLKKVAAALQRQIREDFAPIWKVDCEIVVAEAVAAAPVGCWPVIIKQDLGMPGAAAYHNVKKGSPFALVADTSFWTQSASHQIMEMLVSPNGDRFVSAASVDPQQKGKIVRYLVQVCDPCQEVSFAYRIDGVLVSDFCTPQFFEGSGRTNARYDKMGSIRKPLEILRGGYLSWFDEEGDEWWQQQYFGSSRTVISLGKITVDTQSKSRRQRKSILLTLSQKIEFLQKTAEAKERVWRKETADLKSMPWIGPSGAKGPWRELEPSELDDLYAILNRISDTQLFVFRGHASKNWPHLVTSLSRTLGNIATPVEQAKLEAEGIAAFRRHGRSLLHPSELTYFDRILDGVTLMQHYGAPTRLLDWTLSPWVSAYFVVTDEALKDEDGVIWAFNQAKLLKNYYSELDAARPDYKKFATFISSAEVEDWLTGALEQTSIITTFRYQYANPQMGAQQSLFTICGSAQDCHEVALKRILRDDWDTLRIIVPAKIKKVLRQRLFRMNVSALSLFPSMNGIGLYIAEALRAAFPLGDEGLLYLLDRKSDKPAIDQPS